ncbi:MAG: Bro-N domain-containing protein [Proteobacteria bacterium]|nr:Bro-N domain-containing protein [Pseudomonadota bacterium]
MNTQSVPTVFTFVAQQLRTVMINGEPWFVAADVTSALNIDNTQTRRLDDDEKGVCSIHTLGGQQEMSIINESGLYSLILGSRKPEAKVFKKWVTSEVLPAIRKTGSYTRQADGDAPELISNSDMRNLTRLMWIMTHDFQFEQSLCNACWKSIRDVTGTKSPARFQVRHIPLIATECRRIYSITRGMRKVMLDAEAAAIKQIALGTQDENLILNEMRQKLEQINFEDSSKANLRLAKWEEGDIQSFVRRVSNEQDRHAKFQERLDLRLAA